MSDYSLALDSAVPGISQLVDDDAAQNGTDWMTSLAKLLPSLAATYQQKQFLSLNMQRAQQGLPPLSASDYGLGVSVGLSPEVKQMLIYGAIGIGALIYLTRSRR